MLHLSSKPQVLISLEPGMLVGRVLRGVRVVRTHHSTFGVADWASLWEQDLQSLDETLQRMVTRLGVAPGSHACVIFEAPGAVVEYQSIATGAREAVAAARQGVAERLGIAPDSPCIGVRKLTRAKDGEGRAVTQLLAAGVHEAELLKVYRWVGRAGLQCSGAVPTSAALLDGLATRLLSSKDPTPTYVFHIDRCRSALGSGNAQGITMLRAFDVGLVHMVEAVIRAASSSESGPAKAMSFDRAQAILLETGLPRNSASFESQSGLSVRAVMPTLQPVLQRFSVELKQSLRRVLRDNQFRGVRVLMSGPGAGIPGIDLALGESLEIDLIPAADGNTSRSIAETWADSSTNDLVLRTLAHEVERRNGMLRRAAMAGALLAAAFVGGEALLQTHRLRRVEREIASRAVQVEQVRQLRDLCERARTLEGSISTARDIIGTFVGDQPDWSTSLHEVALAARGLVSLTEIRAEAERNGAFLTIAGLAPASEADSPLNSFLEQLRSSALVEDVEVASRRLIEMDEENLHQFRLKVRLVCTPEQQIHEEDGQ